MENSPRDLLMDDRGMESSDPFDSIVDHVRDWLAERKGTRAKNPVIAIAGFSGSGKSELARRIHAGVGGVILPLDDYYRVDTTYDERPDAFLASYANDLRRLSSGFSVGRSPIFNLSDGVREGWIRREAPEQGEPIITDGLFTIELLKSAIQARTRPILPIYVASSDDLCLRRWGYRANMAGRVHPEPLTAEKWESMVRDYTPFAAKQSEIASQSGYTVLNRFDPCTEVSLGMVI